MNIILALVTIHCNMWFSQSQCVRDHMACIKYVNSIKPTEFVAKEEKLASAYLYCIEHHGELR